MGKAYSADLRERIEAHISAGYSRFAVAMNSAMKADRASGAISCRCRPSRTSGSMTSRRTVSMLVQTVGPRLRALLQP